MLRLLGAVILGYLAMAIAIFGMFTLAYVFVGADGAFQASSFEVSPLWMCVWFVVNLFAAVIGGWVCTLISQDPKAIMGLAVVVLMLGLVFALTAMTNGDRGLVRDSNVRNLGAMMKANEPSWMLLATPAIGVAGVFAGSRLRRGAIA